MGTCSVYDIFNISTQKKTGRDLPPWEVHISLALSALILN